MSEKENEFKNSAPGQDNTGNQGPTPEWEAAYKLGLEACKRSNINPGDYRQFFQSWQERCVPHFSCLPRNGRHEC